MPSKMRSFGEIVFRARQETANFFLLVFPPVFSGTMAPRLNLPNAGAIREALTGSEYCRFVEGTAEEITAHRFPIFGTVIETGPEIHWRRDYMQGKESGLAYFRRVPYLDFAAVGDHKFIWELNRHQHLVLLAQAFLFTRRGTFIREIVGQLESWFEQNPFQRGINWASALEVAFRALSWIWIYHLVGTELQEDFRGRFLTQLYRHGRHLAENLSIYFSPNTHLLGEAVALHALATLFDAFPPARIWRTRSAEIIERQLAFQVRPDGSHFEQSTYYHVYALDLFLFFFVLAERPQGFRAVLTRMGEYLLWLLGPAGRIAFCGDDDGGRLFHPYGERDLFGRATLATCGILLGHKEWIGGPDDISQQAAWWLGAECLREASPQRQIVCGARLFPESGTAFLQSGDLWVQIDCGPFGFGGAGHSHSDTLSLVAFLKDEQIFVDPGTYTYIGDPGERDWFRGSGAHNTIRIDGLDQGDRAGPFRWTSKPQIAIAAWKPSPDGGFVDATCQYKGFSHRRRVLLASSRLLVLDEVDGPLGEHACEQIWQLGSAASKVNLAFSIQPQRVDSQFSPVYGKKIPGISLVANMIGTFPLQIAMLLTLDSRASISVEQARATLEYPVT